MTGRHRVAIVCDYLLDYLGGAQTAMLEQARALAAAGHAVIMIARPNRRSLSRPTPRSLSRPTPRSLSLSKGRPDRYPPASPMSRSSEFRLASPCPACDCP